MELTLKSIGLVQGGRTEIIDDDWNDVRAEIVLDANEFSGDALTGLADFSHIEVLFHFHKGNPVLDIKPVMTGFAPRGPVREPEWAHEIMTDYWHAVGDQKS